MWQRLVSSPRGILVLTTGAILLIAATLSFAFSISPEIFQREGVQFGSILLTVLMLPTLSFFLYRPLVRQIAASQRIQSELQTTKENLETRVMERTRDLNEANRQLSNELVEHKQTAQVLKQTEQKYRGIFENAAEGIYQTTPDGHFLAANPALARILGYASSDELMRAVHDVGQQTYVDPNRGREMARLLERDGEIKDFEFQACRRDGTLRWLVANSRLVRDEAGKPAHYEGILTDITDRKNIEVELRKLSLAVEQCSASIMITNLKGDIEYVNPEFVRVTGYSREEVLGKNPRILKTGETAPEEYEHLWDTITTGGDWRGIFHNRKKNGELYWESAIISPIFDKDGKISNFLGIKEDITARKQAEEALCQSEEHFRSMIENSSDVITVVTMDGTITYESPSLERVLGYKPEELIGRNVFDYLHPDDLPHIAEVFAQALQESGTLAKTEFRYRARDGSWRYIQAVGTARHNAKGDFIGIINSRDISERKKAEDELHEAVAALKAFGVGMEQRNNEMKLLSEMGDFLQSCRTAPEAYAAVAEYAEKLFPNLSGGLGIISGSRNLVEFVAGWGYTAMYERIFAPDDCWALRRGRNYSAFGSNPELYCKHTGLPFPAASVCVPMIAQGEALGILYLRSKETISQRAKSEILIPTQIRLAMTMAEQIALALANLNLREALRSQAIRDGLTGLFNRRFMEETFERELRRAQRHGEPLAVIMLDIDHFKKFNDTFGHAAGDVVLHELGGFLRSRTRGGDFVCRYGGEEIAIIMADIALEDAGLRAEKLRQEIRELQLSFHDEALGIITVSLGVAGYPQHGSNMNALLRAADNALYRAKRAGRDRVVVASVLEEPIPALTESSVVS